MKSVDSSFPRIGSVPHLNARPLIYGIESQVTLLTPARLADAMHRREFDVGLVPVAEVLRHDQYDVIDGIAVASNGPVRSVFLAHRVPLKKVRKVALDPASRSSAWLVRVILKKRFGVAPEFCPRVNGATPAENEALLVFGDEAIEWAARPIPAGETRLDLGAVWTEWTGLPFVYAVWAAQRGAVDAALVSALRRAKSEGLARVEEIVGRSPEGTAEVRREYLTKCIRYDLGAAEKKGLREFQACLSRMKLVERHELRFID